MSTQDRRSGTERRGTNRYSVDVQVEWEGKLGRQPGSLSDVSFDGCFILSSGEVQDGDPVRVFIPLADGMKVQFGGRVANNVFEIGFGVKFDQLSSAQRELLVNLVRESGQA
ncbi:MAG: PilZ domain-containing protein [Pyrinomonadaceae bacterium]|nr:PilZ domain-containing protein [Pyrinomonadaceae bacterium]